MEHHSKQQIKGVNSFLSKRNLDSKLVVPRYVKEVLEIEEKIPYSDACILIQSDFYKFHLYVQAEYPNNGN